MPKKEFVCVECNKVFYNYFDDCKFCSRACFEKHRSKHLYKTCPICGKKFKGTYKGQMFCSVECRVKSTEKQVTFICDCCGKEFTKAEYEVGRSKRNYCSMECRRKGMFWSEEDINILKQTFEEKGRVKFEDVAGRINPKWDKEAVKRKCIYLGLTNDREWTEEETNLLIENYHKLSVDEMTELIPRKTKDSVLAKARTLKLYSKHYIESVYTKEEEQLLIDNYKTMTNTELAVLLGRDGKSVDQKIYALGLNRMNPRSNIDVPLSKFVRGKIEPICENYKIKQNGVCELTHKKCKVNIHHIKSFSELMKETLDILDLPYTIKKEDLTDEELKIFVDTFIENHERQKKYIVIDEEIHNRFHRLYGNGNNTEEQWNEFIANL